MCGLIIDAGILMLVVKFVLNEEVEFFHALITILVASVVGWLVHVGISSGLPTDSAGAAIAAFAVATAATAVVMGVMISFFLGAPFKKACIAGAVFFAVKIVLVIVLVLFVLGVGTAAGAG